MPPIAEIGGGGWTCGARARHHHRERSGNGQVLRAQQDGRVRRGVHHHQLPCVRRRQRQQLAPRATSRWRGGAKQIALAPREGQALEERSSSSRPEGRPRTRDVQLPYDEDGSSSRAARDEQRAPCRGAKEAAQGLAQGGPVDVVHGPRASGRPRTRGVQQPCVTTTTTAAARARQARRANGNAGHVLAISQGPRPCSPRSEGSSRSSTCAASRTNAVRHNDDNGERQRRGRRQQLALEGRDGSSPRTESCHSSSRAAAYRGGQRASRAS